MLSPKLGLTPAQLSNLTPLNIAFKFIQKILLIIDQIKAQCDDIELQIFAMKSL